MDYCHGRVVPSERGSFEYDIFWLDDVLTSTFTYPTRQGADSAMSLAVAICNDRLRRVPLQIDLLRAACATQGLLMRELPGVHHWAIESTDNERSANFWANPLRELGWQASTPAFEAALRTIFLEP